MRHKKILSRNNMLSQYPNRAYIGNGGTGDSIPPPPLPLGNCITKTNNGIGPLTLGEIISYNILIANGTTAVPFSDFYYETTQPPLNPSECASPNGYVYYNPWGFSIHKNDIWQYSDNSGTATVDALVAWCNTNIGPGFTNTMTWQGMDQWSQTFPGWAPAPSGHHNIRLSHTICDCTAVASSSSCLLDIVIGCDTSGSMYGSNADGVNDFVREFVTELDTLMNGSIGGVTGLNDVQVGTYVWSSATNWNNASNYVVQNMTVASNIIEMSTNIAQPPPGTPGTYNILGAQVGGGDDYDVAIPLGIALLNDFASSDLGDRSSQANYRRVMIIITDANSQYNCTSGFSPWSWGTGMNNEVWSVGSIAGNPALDMEVYGLVVHASNTSTPVGYPGSINCLVPTGLWGTNVMSGTGTALGALATTFANDICDPTLNPPSSFNCNNTGSPITAPGGFVAQPGDCYDPGSGLGQYSILNGYASPYNDCVANCGSPLPDTYDCINCPGPCNCVAVAPGVVGQYSTMGGPNGCLANCTSDEFHNWQQCQVQPPNNPWAFTFGNPYILMDYANSYGQTSYSGPSQYNTPTVAAASTVLYNAYGAPNPGEVVHISTNLPTQGPIDWCLEYLGSTPTQTVAENVWDTLAAATYMSTSSDCNSCVSPFLPPESWDCDPITYLCSDPGTGAGQYTDANSGGNPGDGEAACIANCNPPPLESYFCSGASGSGHPNGTLWACYDPQNGTGTYSVLNGYANPFNDCIAACQPPPPESWACSGPNGITLPNGVTHPQWWCYDPGNGTGQHSNIGACQAVCIEPTWDCDMTNYACNLHPTGGGFYNSTNGGYQACLAACGPPESWDCRIWPPTALTGTCTDPGTGLGQYMTWQLCDDACRQVQHVVLEEPEKSWNCEWHWTTYTQGGPNLVGNCNPILGTSGTYNIKQDCLDACREYQAFIDDGLLAADPCELCCCESTPNPPWTCIPGTQVISAGNLNPCNCATMGMIDCTEDVGMGQDGYDCLPDGTCTYVWGNPTYTGANAALNLNLATGINYPNSLAGALAYCEDSCLPVISGTLCPRIRSCPCGWSHGPSTVPGGIDCTDPTGTSTMLAIEKCMEFPMPNFAPAIGDAWENIGYYSILTWNRAVVVDITGTITTTTTQETRSTCN